MIRLYTVLVFVAIGVVMLYVVFDMQKSDFVGNTTLLIVPKNILIAENIDSIVNNIVSISQGVIDGNENITKYNASVVVERLDDTSMIQFETFADAEKDVISVEKNALKQSLIEIEKYYDINDDFAIKIVGKQNVGIVKDAPSVMFGVLAVVIMGVVSGILLLVKSMSFSKEGGSDENLDGEKIFQKYHESKKEKKNFADEDILSLVNSELENQVVLNENEDIEEKEDMVVEENLVDNVEVVDNAGDELEEEKEEIVKDEKENVEAVKEDKNTSFEDVAVPEGLPTTPGNLPVVDISDFGGGDKDVQKDETVGRQTPQEDIEAGKAEPTEEELKARLNELLNGKL